MEAVDSCGEHERVMANNKQRERTKRKDRVTEDMSMGLRSRSTRAGVVGD